MAMHAAFGKPGALRQAPDALFAMLTNRLENDNAFGPPSHGVGPCSEGWLKSWLKSALQSTRSTADCPALRRYPRLARPPNPRPAVYGTRPRSCPGDQYVAESRAPTPQGPPGSSP